MISVLTLLVVHITVYTLPCDATTETVCMSQLCPRTNKMVSNCGLNFIWDSMESLYSLPSSSYSTTMHPYLFFSLFLFLEP